MFVFFWLLLMLLRRSGQSVEQILLDLPNVCSCIPLTQYVCTDVSSCCLHPPAPAPVTGATLPGPHVSARSPEPLAVHDQRQPGQASGQEPADLPAADHQADPHCAPHVPRYPAAAPCCSTTLCTHQRQRHQGRVYVGLRRSFKWGGQRERSPESVVVLVDLKLVSVSSFQVPFGYPRQQRPPSRSTLWCGFRWQP